ncbi:MAG: Crp/Fnr family transcriptional regulator [Bacteroidota bacterium]
MDAFLAYLDTSVPLQEQEKALVAKHCRTLQLAKGTHLLRAGAVSRAFYYNISGLVRLYYLREEREVSAYFYDAGSFISAYESFVRQTPAQLNLQVMEPSILIEINQKAAATLLAASSKFEVIARLAMEEELIAKQHIIANLLSLNPEERYYHLMDTQPSLFQRLPQHYLASYIGVKPESLSRIKKRHAGRKS